MFCLLRCWPLTSQAARPEAELSGSADRSCCAGRQRAAISGHAMSFGWSSRRQKTKALPLAAIREEEEVRGRSTSARPLQTAKLLVLILCWPAGRLHHLCLSTLLFLHVPQLLCFLHSNSKVLSNKREASKSDKYQKLDKMITKN